MSVIRGEIIQETALLSSTGELIFGAQEGFGDLIEEERRKSFEKGQKKGEQLGYEKGSHELKLHAQLLQAIAGKLLEQKARLLEQLKPELIELVIAICERVIRQELRDKERLLGLIHLLLRNVLPSLEEDTLKIVLSPDDLSCVGEALGEIQAVADPMMQRGDCRIEGRMGLLNHDISRVLAGLQSEIHNGPITE